MQQKNLYLYCNIALLMAALISGLSFVAQKLGMLYVGPFTFNTLRCFIGALCIVPMLFIFRDNRRKYSRKNLIFGGILAGIILFFAFSINQYCMIYAKAGIAGFITSLYILFVPIIAVFLKQKLRLNVKISILISVIGLYLLCAENVTGLAKWDILLLVSAFFFALHIVTVSFYSKKANAIKLSLIQFVTAGVLSAPVMLISETPSLDAVLAGWQPILFIGIVVTGAAYTLQIFGHKATKAVLATLILSSEAVFAVLGGMLLLGETLTAREIAGCLIMLSAIVFSQIPNSRRNITAKESIR